MSSKSMGLDVESDRDGKESNGKIGAKTDVPCPSPTPGYRIKECGRFEDLYDVGGGEPAELVFDNSELRAIQVKRVYSLDYGRTRFRPE